MDSTFSHLFKLSESISLEFSILSKKSTITGSLDEIRRILVHTLNTTDLKRFMLAVDEILQNAYEHGNLELNHSEKKALLEVDRLDQELKTREKKYFSRTISIKLERIADMLHLSVTDQGKGFNWKEYLKTPSNQTSLHGKGLPIIRSAVDNMDFNEIGNSIKISKLVSPRS